MYTSFFFCGIHLSIYTGINRGFPCFVFVFGFFVLVFFFFFFWGGGGGGDFVCFVFFFCFFLKGGLFMFFLFLFFVGFFLGGGKRYFICCCFFFVWVVYNPHTEKTGLKLGEALCKTEIKGRRKKCCSIPVILNSPILQSFSGQRSV